MSCTHIERYTTDYETISYEFIHTYYVSCLIKGSLKRKSLLHCGICNAKKDIHACLHCPCFACYEEKHMHQHAFDGHHFLSVNLNFGTVFCYLCKDYVYHEDYEAIARKNSEISRKTYGFDHCLSWYPTAKEVNHCNGSRDVKKIADESLIGLRGMHNCGQTCFINCIIQVFMHTVLLRDYFLSDKHICFQENSSDEPSCLGCEMLKIFQEFYTGKSEPFSAENLVFLLLKKAKHIMDGSQQDAHECFNTMLDLLHQDCSEGIDSSSTHCTCIMHRIFNGIYQSDVVCQRCKKVSTRNEPFLDVGLGLCDDLEDTGKTITLLDCITRHTLAEMIHDGRCTSCTGQHTKRMSFKKLPVVLNFHLKRISEKGKKNETFISFPEVLDMTAFMSEKLSPISTYKNISKLKSRLGSGENKYSLYAVVAHKGNNEGGHFATYVRQRYGKWFRCSDTEIIQVKLEEVLKCEGYVLFYHTQVLQYSCNNGKKVSDFQCKENIISLPQIPLYRNIDTYPTNSIDY